MNVKRLCNRMRRRSAYALLLVLSLSVSVLGTGCVHRKTQKKTSPLAASSEAGILPDASQTVGMSAEDAAYAAKDYADTMTTEQKVGQIFVVNLEQLAPSHGDFYEYQSITREMKENLQKYPVGGIVLFSRNIVKRKQTRKLLRKLQKNAPTPLFACVDEEGGDVARIADNPDMKTSSFPTMEEIGREQDSDYVYQMANTIGSDISQLGFNVDFAPVADVKTSELNQEIGTRSFGDNPKKVAELVSAYVRGLKNQNVCSTLKHFPGQGSSKGDTHQGSVDIDSSIASLRRTDFVPFMAGIKAGADFIMISHISVSKVTETSEPASLSELMMTTILREELGYEGLIITDAFDMACITDNYSAGEAAVDAFEDGADVILMPDDLSEAYQAVLDKVKSDEASEQKLDDIVQRILQVKFQKGIMTLEDVNVSQSIALD